MTDQSRFKVIETEDDQPRVKVIEKRADQHHIKVVRPEQRPVGHQAPHEITDLVNKQDHSAPPATV